MNLASAATTPFFGQCAVDRNSGGKVIPPALQHQHPKGPAATGAAKLKARILPAKIALNACRR
jgi:hypothetical protein